MCFIECGQCNGIHPLHESVKWNRECHCKAIEGSTNRCPDPAYVKTEYHAQILMAIALLKQPS